jgi:hypothetical protein
MTTEATKARLQQQADDITDAMGRIIAASLPRQYWGFVLLVVGFDGADGDGVMAMVGSGERPAAEILRELADRIEHGGTGIVP